MTDSTYIPAELSMVMHSSWLREELAEYTRMEFTPSCLR